MTDHGSVDNPLNGLTITTNPNPGDRYYVSAYSQVSVLVDTGVTLYVHALSPTDRGLSLAGSGAYTGVKGVIQGDVTYTLGLGVKSGQIHIGSIELVGVSQRYDLPVTFDANGGTGGPGTKVYKVLPGYSEITLPSEVPKKTNNKFVGWQFSENPGNLYPAGSNFLVSFPQVTSLKFTAQWEPWYEFTLVYDTNGGTGGPQGWTDHSVEDKYITVIPNNVSSIPTKTGSEFICWVEHKEPFFLEYKPGERVVLSPGRTVLEARWKDPTTHTLIYDANGGTGAPPTESKTNFEDHARFDIPLTIPVWPGHRFEHWSQDMGGGLLVDYNPGDPIAVTGTVTLIAQWTIPVDSVRFLPDQPVQMFVGEAKRFEAVCEPSTATDTRIGWTLSDEVNKITAEEETAQGGIAEVTAGTEPRSFTLVAASKYYDPTKKASLFVHVDRMPVTHGTPADPLRGQVSGTLEDFKSDSFYIESGTDVSMDAVAQTGLTVRAVSVSPEGSGLTVGADGTLGGIADAPGIFTAEVERTEHGITIPYTVTIYIVAQVSVRVESIAVTGPTSVERGQTIELRATTTPDTADNPYVSFQPLNGSVSITDVKANPDRSTTCKVSGVLQGPVTVRVMSIDGGSVLDYPMTVTADVPIGERWTMDASPGIFPNGESVIYGPVSEEGYLLPDWSVVDRPGYRLKHWTRPDGRMAPMAVRQFEGIKWTAVWEEDPRDYSEVLDRLPHAAIRVYRDLNEYVDLTMMCVLGREPTIQMAENRPEQAAFGVVNEYEDPTRHLLGAGCALWSSGPDGPIDTGMYCRIEDIQPDGTVTPLLDGFITTITPDADAGIIAITVGDRKTILARSGTDLRRNYYEGREADARIDAGFDTRLYGDLTSLPGDAQVEPPYAWAVPKDVLEAASGAAAVYSMKDNNMRFFTATMAPLPVDILRTIRIHATQYFPGAISREYTSRGQIIITTDAGKYTRSYTKTWDYKVDGFTFDFDLTTDREAGIPVRGPVTIELTTNITSFTNNVSLDFSTHAAVTSSMTFITTRGPETYAMGPILDISGFVWTPCEATREGSRMYISSIEGVTELDSPTLYTPATKRMSVSYLAKNVSTVQVMSGVAQAVGAYPLANNAALGAQETVLKVFRTGGGYAQDYLQKLADVPSKDKRMRAYRSRGFMTPVVIIGARHAVGEPAAAVLKYGGDRITTTIPTIDFSTFSPMLTMKNRPSLIMVRGSGTTFDGKALPLMVAVEDPASRAHRHGVSVEQVFTDSSINSALGAARAGYAQVTSRDLDTWEGTMVLPGIIPTLMELGGPYAGSGVPVTIYDSRNGLTKYPARVKEAKMDYNACTTAVTLVNHGVVYSSSLGDTVATAITAADVATGSSDNSLFDTQYVRVVAGVPQTVDRETSTNKVTLVLGIGTETVVDNVTFLDYPGNRTTMVAVAPPDGDGHTDGTRPYDVVAVRINNGGRITIPAPVRPDYYKGQTLIVNVDFPTR